MSQIEKKKSDKIELSDMRGIFGLYYLLQKKIEESKNKFMEG